jgi:GntR family transcriptional regulator
LPNEENESRITSTMKIDQGAPTPLYQQVAAELRRAIADGEVRPGERMPLAKDLAAVLGVNRNTVLRALGELRDEGLLEYRRGRGITVSGTPQRGALLEKVRDLVAFARREGYATEELIAMIEAVS